MTTSPETQATHAYLTKVREPDWSFDKFYELAKGADLDELERLIEPDATQRLLRKADIITNGLKSLIQEDWDEDEIMVDIPDYRMLGAGVLVGVATLAGLTVVGVLRKSPKALIAVAGKSNIGRALRLAS